MPRELDGQLMFGEAAEIIRQGEREKYTAFVDKFKPSKTTDDCYTPQPVMDVVSAWVEKEYGISRERFVRPFWPGGNYQAFDYPAGCAVVDNPPFSILSGIVRWYVGRGIRFFLFAPALTLFNQRGNSRDVTYIAAGADVIYENGANVRTSFITNLDTWQLRTAPELTREVTRISRELASQGRKELPKYVYPDAVITAARCQWMSEHGVDYRLGKEDAVFISTLDAQLAQASVDRRDLEALLIQIAGVVAGGHDIGDEPGQRGEGANQTPFLPVAKTSFIITGHWNGLLTGLYFQIFEVSD